MNKSVKKVCIIGTNFINDNLGVGALAYGSLRVVLHSYPDAEVFLMDYQKEPINSRIRRDGCAVDVPVLNIRFSKRLMLPNNIALLMAKAMLVRCVPVHWIREKLACRNPYFKQIKETDLVFAISGGDSFSDIYGMKRMFYVSFPQLLILLLEKPLTLLPQTIGPFKRTLAQWIARKILRKAETVYSRDQEGIEYTRELIGAMAADNRVQFSPDVAFVMDPVRFDTASIDGGMDRLLKDERPVVGLNVSGLLYVGGYNRNNMFGLRDDYKALMHALVRFFINEKNTHIVLIPHVLGAEEKPESDRHACREIYKAFGEYQGEQLHLVQGDYQANEIKYLIGQCDFFLGSRLHACIGALSQHVPAAGLAYSRKFDGVLKSANVDSLVIDLRTLTNEEVIAQVDKSFDDRAALRERLHKSIPQIKKTVLQMFSGTSAL